MVRVCQELFLALLALGFPVASSIESFTACHEGEPTPFATHICPYTDGETLVQRWDPVPVVFSIAEAIMGSYITIMYIKRISQVREWMWYKIFIVMSGISFGFSAVWTMHFVGMKALLLGNKRIHVSVDGGEPVEVYATVKLSFEGVLTIISLVAAVIVVSVGVTLISLRDLKSEGFTWDTNEMRIAKVAVFMAVSVGIMHYLGMWAQTGKFDMEWSAGIIVASVILALVVCYVGLKILFTKYIVQSVQNQMLTAVVIGLAVASVHYTGMQAATYKFKSTRRDTIFSVWVNDFGSVYFFLSLAMIKFALGLALHSYDRYIKNSAFDMLEKELYDRCLLKLKNREGHKGIATYSQGSQGESPAVTGWGTDSDVENAGDYMVNGPQNIDSKAVLSPRAGSPGTGLKSERGRNGSVRGNNWDTREREVPKIKINTSSKPANPPALGENIVNSSLLSPKSTAKRSVSPGRFAAESSDHSPGPSNYPSPMPSPSPSPQPRKRNLADVKIHVKKQASSDMKDVEMAEVKQQNSPGARRRSISASPKNIGHSPGNVGSPRTIACSPSKKLISPTINDTDGACSTRKPNNDNAADLAEKFSVRAQAATTKSALNLIDNVKKINEDKNRLLRMVVVERTYAIDVMTLINLYKKQRKKLVKDIPDFAQPYLIRNINPSHRVLSSLPSKSIFEQTQGWKKEQARMRAKMIAEKLKKRKLRRRSSLWGSRRGSRQNSRSRRASQPHAQSARAGTKSSRARPSLSSFKNKDKPEAPTILTVGKQKTIEEETEPLEKPFSESKRTGNLASITTFAGKSSSATKDLVSTDDVQRNLLNQRGPSEIELKKKGKTYGI